MKTVLNVKTDYKLKKDAQRVAKAGGIPLSLVVNSALRQFVARRSILIEAPLIPNKKTARILDSAIKDIKAGKNISPMFNNAEEMDRYLDLL